MPGRDHTARSSSCRLRLFMAGEEPNSVMARENLRHLVENHLDESGVRIEIIDVFRDYRAALEHKILVTPALLASGPGGEVVVLGNLRDTGKVIAALRQAGVETTVCGKSR